MHRLKNKVFHKKLSAAVNDCDISLHPAWMEVNILQIKHIYKIDIDASK